MAPAWSFAVAAAAVGACTRAARAVEVDAGLAACLRRGVTIGELFFPGDPGYDDAKHLVNIRRDIEPFPVAIVRPGSVKEVQHAVRCTAKSSKQACAKGMGHGFDNAAACTGGVMVDMAAFSQIDIDANGGVVRFGAGNCNGQLYHELAQFGMAVPCGTESSVGSVGLTLGCGRGYLTQLYGRACDSVLQVEYVDADGHLQVIGDAGFVDIPLEYVGCFANTAGPNHLTGHVDDYTLESCKALARRDSKPVFGLEWPEGPFAPGRAQCLPLADVPQLSKVADTECDGKVTRGHRLGGPGRLAVYRLRSDFLEEAGPDSQQQEGRQAPQAEQPPPPLPPAVPPTPAPPQVLPTPQPPALGAPAQPTPGAAATFAPEPMQMRRGRRRRLGSAESQDMLWMAKGGGGEFPGIVVRMHMKAHPYPGDIQSWHCRVDTTMAKPVIKRWLAFGAEVTPDRRIFTKVGMFNNPTAVEFAIHCLGCDPEQQAWAHAKLQAIVSGAEPVCESKVVRSFTDQILWESGYDAPNRFAKTPIKSDALTNCSNGWRHGAGATKNGAHMGYTWNVTDEFVEDVLRAVHHDTPALPYSLLILWYLTSAPNSGDGARGGSDAKWVFHYKHMWHLDKDEEWGPILMAHHKALSTTLDKHLPCSGFYNYLDKDLPCAKTNDDWLAAYFSDVPRMMRIKSTADPTNVFRSRLNTAGRLGGAAVREGVSLALAGEAISVVGAERRTSPTGWSALPAAARCSTLLLLLLLAAAVAALRLQPRSGGGAPAGLGLRPSPAVARYRSPGDATPGEVLG